MVFEQAVTSAIQVILASWVAIVTAGAGYLFLRGQRLELRLVSVERQLDEARFRSDLLEELGDPKALSGRGDHE